MEVCSFLLLRIMIFIFEIPCVLFNATHRDFVFLFITFRHDGVIKRAQAETHHLPLVHTVLTVQYMQGV